MVCRFYGIDVVNAVNLVLCLLILTVGCLAYVKTKIKTPFHIGVAFGLFAVTHLIALFGAQGCFMTTIILLRTFAYLIVLSIIWEMRSRA